MYNVVYADMHEKFGKSTGLLEIIPCKLPRKASYCLLRQMYVDPAM